MDIHFYLIILINPMTLLKYILMQDYLKATHRVGHEYISASFQRSVLESRCIRIIISSLG